MNVSDLLVLFRTELIDIERPYVWADELVYLYIDDAQKMFCRLTEGIEDGRSFTLAITSGNEWYTIDSSILKLRKAYNAATGQEIRIVNTEKAQDFGILFNGQTGPLRAFVAGIEKHALRAWPMPNAAMKVPLEVFRLPATVEASSELEIDEQHHLALLKWVKHKAFSVHDAETYDARKSAEYEAQFRTYCTQARAEQGRARHNTGTVIYGGI